MVTNATVPPIRVAQEPRYAEAAAPEIHAHSVDLCQMTKAQLLDLAAERGLEAKPTLRKSELIDLIERAGA